MADIGAKASRKGYNVNDADLDDKNLSFSSKFNTFKCFRVIHTSAIGDHLHGLDYPPVFLAVIDTDVSGDYYPAVNGYISGGVPYVSVDDTKVYSHSADDMYIFLFVEPLDELD